MFGDPAFWLDPDLDEYLLREAIALARERTDG